MTTGNSFIIIMLMLLFLLLLLLDIDRLEEELKQDIAQIESIFRFEDGSINLSDEGKYIHSYIHTTIPFTTTNTPTTPTPTPTTIIINSIATITTITMTTTITYYKCHCLIQFHRIYISTIP